MREKEPPKRETRFLERLASSEGGSNEGYRPPWVASSYLPNGARSPKPPTVLHHGERLKPATIYPPEDRKIYNDRRYPWGCVCKVTTAAGRTGSGCLIGPRHVLTASHCVDWTTSGSI
jgi:V8-like Glu-specific endopeptidase